MFMQRFGYVYGLSERDGGWGIQGREEGNRISGLDAYSGVVSTV